ncbi:MAG: hypothetical protein B7X98_02250, partial [Methylophilaceae bacterium 17-43-7]
MLVDRFPLRRRLQQVQALFKQQKPVEKSLTDIANALQRSAQKMQARLSALPKPEYPSELPVSAKKDDIAAAIQQHQVVIVCGETGSGKTTQL